MAVKLYGFDALHADSVAEGTKRQTVRPARKSGHAVPGDTLRLWTGLRTKSARFLREAVCASADPVTICTGEPIEVFVGGRRVDVVSFAKDSGFDSPEDMASFYRAKHGEDVFSGMLIRW